MMVFQLQLQTQTALLPRKRKLQCRNGYFLEVRPDGTVRGTKNNDSIYSKLKIYHHYASTLKSSTKKNYLLAKVQDFKLKTIQIMKN